LGWIFYLLLPFRGGWEGFSIFLFKSPLTPPKGRELRFPLLKEG